ncbi:hypothetical protein KC352_g76 [Hortaea werneckii]|nr:hypothetical protein KC352_g76 [Hortaea werneckii]
MLTKPLLRSPPFQPQKSPCLSLRRKVYRPSLISRHHTSIVRPTEMIGLLNTLPPQIRFGFLSVESHALNEIAEIDTQMLHLLFRQLLKGYFCTGNGIFKARRPRLLSLSPAEIFGSVRHLTVVDRFRLCGLRATCRASFSFVRLRLSACFLDQMLDSGDHEQAVCTECLQRRYEACQIGRCLTLQLPSGVEENVIGVMFLGWQSSSLQRMLPFLCAYQTIKGPPFSAEMQEAVFLASEKRKQLKISIVSSFIKLRTAKEMTLSLSLIKPHTSGCEHAFDLFVPQNKLPARCNALAGCSIAVDITNTRQNPEFEIDQVHISMLELLRSSERALEKSYAGREVTTPTSKRDILPPVKNVTPGLSESEHEGEVNRSDELLGCRWWRSWAAARTTRLYFSQYCSASNGVGVVVGACVRYCMYIDFSSMAKLVAWQVLLRLVEVSNMGFAPRLDVYVIFVNPRLVITVLGAATISCLTHKIEISIPSRTVSTSFGGTHFDYRTAQDKLPIHSWLPWAYRPLPGQHLCLPAVFH